jgi:hypothetical protein
VIGYPEADNVTQSECCLLDPETGIAREGSKVTKGQILVGKTRYLQQPNGKPIKKDYSLRLSSNEDCYVDRVDPATFEAIINQEISFAVPLICTVLDDPGVIVGLDKLTHDFLNTRGFEMPIPYSDIKAPNTNFMLVNLNYFRNHQLVQEFLQEVDNSHGIYSNRWGDAPIWGIIIYLLSGEDFFELSDTGYLHGSHNHYVNPIQYQYEF